MVEQLSHFPNKGYELAPYPGLFYYSGFGLGYLYKADGTREWMSFTEAVKESAELGLNFSFVDSMEGFKITAVQDR
jgi:hypothetical protein